MQPYYNSPAGHPGTMGGMGMMNNLGGMGGMGGGMAGVGMGIGGPMNPMQQQHMMQQQQMAGGMMGPAGMNPMYGQAYKNLVSEA
jgi:hypothetical protein